MSPTSHALPSPISPLSSRSNSFGPQNHNYNYPPSPPPQSHNQKSIKETIISPVSPHYPPSDTSTVNYHLSPVAQISPDLHVPGEMLHDDHRDEPTRNSSESNNGKEEPHLARGNTLHLQDHIPFKPATAATLKTTRFPPRKPPVPPKDDIEEDTSIPMTTYLSDHQPHRLAAPLPPIPSHQSPIHTPTMSQEEDIEMQPISLSENDYRSKMTRPLGSIELEEEGSGYEAKRRKRNWMIGIAFVVLSGAAIALFAVLAVEANKSDGVAG